MLKNFMKTTAATVTLMALSLLPAKAHTFKPYYFKEASISFETGLDGRNANADHRQDKAAILRVGHDGDKYTHLDGSVIAKFRIKAKVESGLRIWGYVITTGDPVQRGDVPEILIGKEDANVGDKKINRTVIFKMDAVMAANTGPGGISFTRVQDMIDQCNAKFPEPPESDQIIDKIDMTVHAGFAAGERGKLAGGEFHGTPNGPWYDDRSSGPPAIDEATFPVNIVCAGEKFRIEDYDPLTAAGDLKREEGDFKVRDIKLFLSTFSNATTQPNPATVCKKGRVLVRLNASKAGNAKFKLWTNIGGGISSKVVDAWAFHDGNGGFEAEHIEWVSVNKPTQIQAMAEELVSTNGFNKSTQWKNLMLQCSGAGGGDLVQDSLPPDNVLPDAKYSGEITVADSALTPKNQCPRQGQTVFKIDSNNSSPVDYRVDCTGGRSWQGTMQMFANGANKYQGTAAKTFDVEKTEFASCVLKRVKDDTAYFLGFAGKQFSCADPALPPATTDLTPNPGRPEDPPANLQTLKGDFGIADYGAPKCDRLAKALVTFKSPKADNIHWSLDCKFQNKSGVVTPQPHPEGGYMAATLVSLDVTKTVDESCTLRTVAPYAPKDHVTKAHQFICATPSGHSASNDLQVEPKPQSRNPRVPAVLIPDAVVSTKSDAVKRRREAAKDAAIAKRKREAAAANARKVKAAKDAAIAKRKREAAKKAAAAAALAKRKAAAVAIARQKAIAAQALARRKALAVKKRAAPRRTSTAVQRRVIRRR